MNGNTIYYYRKELKAVDKLFNKIGNSFVSNNKVIQKKLGMLLLV